MNRTHKLVNASCIVIALASALPVHARKAPPAQAFSATVSTRVPTASLWRDRGSIAALNLVYGSGSKEQQPSGKFTFVKEDNQATSPKFEIVDEQGVRWKVKLGEETKSETAATRLVWAAGYFTDEDYYRAELHVAKMPKLHRGSQFVSAKGVVRGARLERIVQGQKKSGNWSWFKHPLEGTKELNGLRIMMALVNNWDLKEVNNAIYVEPGKEPRYAITDLGATFGHTGNLLTRSKSDLSDYRGTKFIKEVKHGQVDFHLRSRPFFLTVFAVPNYVKRTRMQDIVKDIPKAHAKWLGHLLGQLSTEQIRDCFRTAGYSPREVEGFAKVVQGRIAQLNRL